MQEERFMKIAETARRLGVSERTARRLIKSGRLPSTFFAGAYRVSSQHLEQFIQEGEVRPRERVSA